MSTFDIADASAGTVSLSPATDNGSVVFLDSNVAAEPAGHHVPLIINSAQAYYWSHRWQKDEAESLRDIAAGDVEIVGDGAAAVRWLLTNDD